MAADVLRQAGPELPGSAYTEDDGINDANQIVDSYVDGTGFRGLLTTRLAAPVPERSSRLLLALEMAYVIGCPRLRWRGSATA